MFFKIKKMPLNALNLIDCQFNIAQTIIMEDIGTIIKGALDVFSSVLSWNTFLFYFLICMYETLSFW